MQESQITDRKPLVPLGELCIALSADRLGAYSDKDNDRDSTDAVARYLWNGALCNAFNPSLHALEVTLRNNIFRCSHGHVVTMGRSLGTFRCWLTASPTFLFAKEAEKVADAIKRIGPDRRYHTQGRLIAKLGFGFWTALMYSPYDHSRRDGPKLWPKLLGSVFPHQQTGWRTREAISARFDDIREFRNRIAHHEPIWDRDPLMRYDEILGALSWMYPSMAKAVRLCGDLEITYHRGPEQFRELASRLLGSPDLTPIDPSSGPVRPS